MKSEDVAKSLGMAAEANLNGDMSFIIMTVPNEGGLGHIASNLGPEEVVNALQNAINTMNFATQPSSSDSIN